jgi:GTP-binding protein
MFVDRVTIRVQAGNGGAGCVSFRREKYLPRGGPDGGDGGDGGSVILTAEPGVDSLVALAHRRQWEASSGEPGAGSNCHGASAKDLTIRVPPGTVVFDASKGFVIKDLATAGASVTAARGGKGGKGNTRFKSGTNRAPRTATPGGEGESRELVLELKIIADVGLLGKPNAGKSTLLSRLSHARPKIADYPFTTKTPNLGIVQLDIERSFTMADIPGLIEGAHEGAGLGLEFLRHVERSGVLVHLVEPTPQDGSDPIQNYRAIYEELRQYSATLAERPQIVVVSKAELPGADQIARQLAEEIHEDVLSISSLTGQGLSGLLYRIDGMLREAKAAAGSIET